MIISQKILLLLYYFNIQDLDIKKYLLEREREREREREIASPIT
jgi:hypothetical protein